MLTLPVLHYRHSMHSIKILFYFFFNQDFIACQIYVIHPTRAKDTKRRKSLSLPSRNPEGKKQEEVGSGNHFIEGVLDENKKVEFRAMKKGENPHYSRKCFNHPPIVQQRKRLFC